jgi:hypothetical protein
MFSLLCLAFNLGPELGMLWRKGRLEIFEAFCVAQRALAMESCLWARYLEFVRASFYMFSTFIERIPDAFGGSQIHEKISVDACLDVLGEF